MIIITGGAGFIGSNLVLALNRMGIDDIFIVDNLQNGKKCLNLASAKITDYIDAAVFREQIRQAHSFSEVDVLFHLGACADTTEWDGRYMMDNNYQYSKELLAWCQRHKVAFIYASSASVYGDGSQGFTEKIECEKPLNVYAYSKWCFDQWVRRQIQQDPLTQIVGLRYFNVYGPHEAHKKHMASVAWHLIQQYRQGENLKLFAGYDGYEAGCQQRDFIYVEDAVNVNLWFWRHPHISGIYNCGTGQAQPFNDLAYAIQSIYQEAKIDYIPFPEKLKNAYQSYTQADISQLREVGFRANFQALSSGIAHYLKWVNQSYTT